MMPLSKRLSPNQLSGNSPSVEVGADVPKLQFPPLPQEWKDRYVPGQMYKYQASLPKLPVPPLQQTLHKYITSVEVRELPQIVLYDIHATWCILVSHISIPIEQ